MAKVSTDYYVEKVEAYHVAINALLMHESETDNEFSKRLRDRLATKLGRELDRWCRAHPLSVSANGNG